MWSSRQPQIDRGDGNRLGGIYYASARLDSALHVPDVHIPAKLPPRVKDWCLRGDVVANWAWSNYAQYGTGQQTAYAGSGYIARAADEAVNTYNGLLK